jgi:hypothetical protein
MSDIVERLRGLRVMQQRPITRVLDGDDLLMLEAADEIVQLRNALALETESAECAIRRSNDTRDEAVAKSEELRTEVERLRDELRIQKNISEFHVDDILRLKAQTLPQTFAVLSELRAKHPGKWETDFADYEGTLIHMGQGFFLPRRQLLEAIVADVNAMQEAGK